MDMVTLAMLNSLKKSGGAGYSEPGSVYTFDGDLNGKTTLPGSLVGLPENNIFVKVTDKVIDENELASITVVVRNMSGTYDRSKLTVVRYGAMFFAAPDNTYVVAVIPQDLANSQGVEAGTYVLYNESERLYVSSVQFTETIHPIDPKFLPGVCLPVVDFTPLGIISEMVTIISDPAFANTLDNLVESAHAFIGVLALGGEGEPVVSMIFTKMVTNSGANDIFVSNSGGFAYGFMKGEDGTWVLVNQQS